MDRVHDKGLLISVGCIHPTNREREATVEVPKGGNDVPSNVEGSLGVHESRGRVELTIHPVHENLVQKSLRGERGRCLCLKREIRYRIAPVVQTNARTIKELNVLQAAVH